MFSFFKKQKNSDALNNVTPSQAAIDPAIIAVITAAITRFRQSSTSASKDVGFVVRRVRRI